MPGESREGRKGGEMLNEKNEGENSNRNVQWTQFGAKSKSRRNLRLCPSLMGAPGNWEQTTETNLELPGDCVGDLLESNRQLEEPDPRNLAVGSEGKGQKAYWVPTPIATPQSGRPVGYGCDCAGRGRTDSMAWSDDIWEYGN